MPLIVVGRERHLENCLSHRNLMASLFRTLLSLGEPIEEDGEFRIITGLWCGPLCGSGGAQQLEQLEDGTWTLTGPVGTQWLS